MRLPPAVAALACLLVAVCGCGPDLEPRPPPAVVAPAPAPVDTRPVRRFATVDRNVLRAARQVVPLTEYLERVSGVRLEMDFFEDYEAQIEAVVSGRAAFAWLSPTGYVRARGRVPVEPLVRAVQSDRSTYRSVLVVRRDDPAQVIEDLRGRRVAFVHADSTSGNVFPRAWLRAQGWVPEEFFSEAPFAGSHFRALYGVIQGEWDAAFVEDGTLLTTRDQLPPSTYRELAEVATIPNGPVVAHLSVPAAEREAVRNALLALATEPRAEALRFGLHAEVKIQSFRPTRDEDYGDVRRHVQTWDKIRARSASGAGVGAPAAPMASSGDAGQGAAVTAGSGSGGAAEGPP